MKVLHAAAEIFPLIKTGGLADVLGALPQALMACGADTRLILPGLPAILAGVEQATTVCEIGPVFGAGKVSLKLGHLASSLPGQQPGSKLAVYVVDAPYLYARAGNPYLAADGEAWRDNLQRFALLGWVAAHVAAGELDVHWCPDILHAHDWHAALACAYVATRPASTVKTVYTIHNLAYQGLFDAADFHLTGLPARIMTPAGLEFHGQFSFMKAGLTCADKVTTVSPAYAMEIATPAFGCGLDGVVRARGSNVSGILNGVEGSVWDPALDRDIAAPYSADKLEGKAACKTALQKALGLRVDASLPLFGIVSRLTEQKGLDLVLAALPALLHSGAQLALLGSGDAALEAAFTAAAGEHSGRVAIRLGYDEAFAHQIIASSDVILVPSRFEPCGLTQLYGLRYGTVPLVRQVGGLADTVVNATPEALQQDAATGFMFGPATADALASALREATRLYAQPERWQQIMRRGMAQNFSWERAARQYLSLYEELAPPGSRNTQDKLGPNSHI